MSPSSSFVESHLNNNPITSDPHPNITKATLPIEILETIIGLSNVSSLKSWTTVCRTLLPSARYHLFTRATLCLRSRSDAIDFIESSNTTVRELPSAAPFVRRMKLRGSEKETECWFPELLEHLNGKLEDVDSLIVDFNGVPVDYAIFTRLTGLSRRGYKIKPLPNLRHLHMVGAGTVAIYRVLEMISLFPLLETLKMDNFRWNISNRLYHIPFPAHLRHIEADIQDTLTPALFMLAFFDQSEQRPEMSSFTLRVTGPSNEQDKPWLDPYDDIFFEPQHRHYFIQVLQSLNRVMPNVENLKIEVPFDDEHTEADTRSLLEKHRILQNLRHFSLNSMKVIENTE